MSMERAFATETALGGGNCAFNAFILAIAEQDVLDKIETNLILQQKKPDIELKDLITLVNQALLNAENPTWRDIKNVLIQTKKTDKNHLQNALNHKIRQFAISRIENNALIQQRHFASTLNPLLGEFENYFLKPPLSGISAVGDIFIAHGFVVTRFDIALNLHKDNLEKAKENVKKWWEMIGYKTFLADMKTPGTWAGDLELAVLADYMGVNLDVISTRFNHKKFTMHFNYGVLETKSIPEETIKQLVTRGVIDQTPIIPGQYRWAKHFSEEELTSVLSEAPEWKKINNYFSSLPSHSLKGKPIHLCKTLKSLLDLVDLACEGKRTDPVYSKEADEVRHIIKQLSLPKNDHEQIEDEITGHTCPMKQSALPFEVSMEGLASLENRGILRQNPQGKIIFLLTKAQAHSRASEIKESAEIINSWKRSHVTQPVVTLQNNLGIHWDNMYRIPPLPKPKPVEKNEEKKAEKKFQWKLNTCEKRCAYVSNLFSKTSKKTNTPQNFDDMLKEEKRKSDNRASGNPTKLEEDIKNKKFCSYHADDKTTLFVSRTSFAKLDRALAFKLQKELQEEEKIKTLSL